MNEPAKPESDVELPSLSLPGDETQIEHLSAPIDVFGLRDEPESLRRGTSATDPRPAVPSPDEIAPSDDGAYSVSQSPSEPPDPPATARAAPSIGSTFEPASSDASDTEPADFPADPPTVAEVWSRWVEWKEPFLWTAAAIGLVLLIHLGGAYVTGLILLAGLSYGAYHFIITLEVPVRVTPEQAAKEFFAALGHRLPNFPRAFALLTDDGRQADEFSELGDFRAYWTAQLARLSKFPVWLTPLEFRIEGASCRYNAEKTMAVLKYKLRVMTRGKSPDGSSLAELDACNLAVKGPDGQWYLNDGRMPGTKREASELS